MKLFRSKTQHKNIAIFWLISLMLFLGMGIFGADVRGSVALRYEIGLLILTAFPLVVFSRLLFYNYENYFAWGLIVILFFSAFHEVLSLTFIKNNGFFVFISALVLGLIPLLNKKESLPTFKEGTHPFKVKRTMLLWVCSLCLLFLGFGVQNLGTFMSVDEPKWLAKRVPQLYKSVSNGEWANTYINDKPGVIPAALAGIVNLFVNEKPFIEIYSNPHVTSAEGIETYLFFWRLPILLFNTTMLFLIAHFLARLYPYKLAMTIFTLIALNPLLLGISQVVNPDATLWSTTFIALLTFFLYLNTNIDKYLYLSGLFFGLALLSKFFATFLYIILPFTVLIEFFTKSERTIPQLLQRLWDTLKIFAISIVVYFIGFPAVWVDASKLLKGTINFDLLRSGFVLLFPLLLILFFDLYILDGKVIRFIRRYRLVFIGGMFVGLFVLLTMGYSLLNASLFNFPFFNVPEFIRHDWVRGDEGQFFEILQSNYTLTLFILTIPLLIGWVGMALNMIFFKEKGLWNKVSLLSAFFFVIIYLSVTGIAGEMAFSRYQIMLMPLFALLAGYWLYTFIPINKWFIIGILTFYGIGILLYSPYYYTYENFLNFQEMKVTDAWGFGAYEIAQYLNEHANTEEDVLWVDREGALPFYDGKGWWRNNARPFLKENSIDYLMLSTRGQRKFEKAYVQWKKGKDNFYTKISGRTPILEYYKRKGEFRYCVRNNPHNCYWLVEIEEEDYISEVEKN